MNHSFVLEERTNYVSNFDQQIKRPDKRTNTRVISLNAGDVDDANQRADELIETLADGSLKSTLCGKLAIKNSLKQFSRRDMRNHTETHLGGLYFDCQLCGKTFRSRNSLKVHRSLYHKNQ